MSGYWSCSGNLNCATGADDIVLPRRGRVSVVVTECGLQLLSFGLTQWAPMDTPN